MKINVIIIVFLCIIFFLTGCVSMTPKDSRKFAVLEIDNTTEYEIVHIYAKMEHENNWGPNLLSKKGIPPNTMRKIQVPNGQFILKAEIIVKDNLLIKEHNLEILSGKNYHWTLSDEAWLNTKGMGYDYLGDTYSYM